MFERALEKYIRFVVDHPKVTAFAMLLILAFFTVSASRVVIDNDFRKMVIQGTGDMDFLDRHNEVFGPDDTSLFIVLTPRDVAMDTFVSFTEKLSDTFLENEDVLRVESLTHTNVVVYEEDELRISPAFGTQSLGSGGNEERLDRLLNNASTRYLVSPDRESYLVIVILNEAYKEVAKVIAPANDVRERTFKLIEESGLNIDADFGGVAYTRTGAVRAIRKDLITLIPFIYLIVGILLYLQYPRAHGVLLPIIGLGSSCTIAVGIATLIGEAITPMSMAFPILLLVIGIGDSLHFLTRFHEERRLGKTPKEAAIQSGRTVGMACLLTSFTSACGFGSLYLTDMPILMGFGLITAIGLLVAFLVLITVMPVGLSLLKSDPIPERKRVSSGIEAIVSQVTTYPRATLVTIIAIVACISCALAARDLNMNYAFSKILSADDPISSGNRLLDSKFTGLLGIDISLRGGPDSFKDPETLKRMDRVIERLKSDVGVDRAFGLSSIVRDLHRSFTGLHTVPDDAPTVGQLLFLTESNRAIIERLVTLDYSECRITVSKRGLDGDRTIELRDQINKIVGEEFEDTEIQTKVTGIALLSATGFQSLIGRLVESLLSALVIIMITLAIVFRSVRVGFACILPNVMPLILALGFYGFSDIPLELMPAVMFCIAIGIAVDDTIHLLTRFNEEKLRCASIREAIHRAVQHSVGAVVNTSCILVSGFGILYFSNFPANQSSSLLGACIIFLALLSDLVLMPSGLRLFWRDDPPSQV